MTDLALTLKEGRWRGRVDVVYAVWSALDTQAAKGIQDDIRLDLTPETYVKALDAGLILHKELPISDSARRLKVIVRDSLTGATGSVDIPMNPERR